MCHAGMCREGVFAKEVLEPLVAAIPADLS
jgi:hypothetical protein